MELLLILIVIGGLAYFVVSFKKFIKIHNDGQETFQFRKDLETLDERQRQAPHIPLPQKPNPRPSREPAMQQTNQRVLDILVMADVVENRNDGNEVGFNFLLTEICRELKERLGADEEIFQRWATVFSRSNVRIMLREMESGGLFRQDWQSYQDETSGKRRRRRTFTLERRHPQVLESLNADTSRLDSRSKHTDMLKLNAAESYLVDDSATRQEQGAWEAAAEAYIAVGEAALFSTETIKGRWSDLTKITEPMDNNAHFLVTTEFYLFYVNLMDRVAFTELSEQRRSALMDNLADLGLNFLIKSLFPGAPQKFRDGVVADELENYNITQQGYGLATVIFAATQADLYSELYSDSPTSMTSLLTRRIKRALEMPLGEHRKGNACDAELLSGLVLKAVKEQIPAMDLQAKLRRLGRL